MSDSNSNAAEAINNAGKIHQADNLRLMADNQRTLDICNAADRVSRDLPPVKESSEDMRILVDSPTTTNHYHPEPAIVPDPVKPVAAGYTTRALITAAILGSALGAGAFTAMNIVAKLADPPAVEVPIEPIVGTPIDTNTEYEAGIRFE